MKGYVVICWHTPWVAHGYEIAGDSVWIDEAKANDWRDEQNAKAGVTPLADELRGGAYYANEGEYEVVEMEVIE